MFAILGLGFLIGLQHALEADHIAAVSTIIALLGWWIARARFKEPQLAGDSWLQHGLARAVENKWYVDEMYDLAVVRPLERISIFLWRGIDAAIDGLLALLGYFVEALGTLLRFLQTGNVRNYALMFFAGVVVFVWVFA